MEDSSWLGMPPLGLRGKIAVVTGVSRPRNIGAAICRAFAACGVDVLFTHWLAFDHGRGYDADEAKLAVLERELCEYGGRVVSIETDLSIAEAARRVMTLTTDRLGAPTILVNNAAHWSAGGIDSLDAASLDAHYAVNLRAM